MSTGAHKALIDNMKSSLGQDFTLEQIYRIVCRPPHLDLSVKDLHSRCSRAIGAARIELKRQGFVLVPGDLKSSYRVVRRHAIRG